MLNMHFGIEVVFSFSSGKKCRRDLSEFSTRALAHDFNSFCLISFIHIFVFILLQSVGYIYMIYDI